MASEMRLAWHSRRDVGVPPMIRRLVRRVLDRRVSAGGMGVAVEGRSLTTTMEIAFGGVPQLPAEVAIRLVLAFVVGACVGVERQWNHKNAGLRTHTLVAVGAAAFTIVSALGLGPTTSPMLVAAGVVTGIGFIGGGVIMHDGHGVHGLNTAATLWTTASMGLAAGGGYYIVTGMIFVAVLMVQCPLVLVEQWIDRASDRRKRMGTTET
jgi:uncharacterized membrane protein YhiD involved in acid resistance